MSRRFIVVISTQSNLILLIMCCTLAGCTSTEQTWELTSKQKAAFTSSRTVYLSIEETGSPGVATEDTWCSREDLTKVIEQTGRSVVNAEHLATMKIIITWSPAYNGAKYSGQPPYSYTTIYVATGESRQGEVRISVNNFPTWRQNYNFGWGGSPPGYISSFNDLPIKKIWWGHGPMSTLCDMLAKIDTK